MPLNIPTMDFVDARRLAGERIERIKEKVRKATPEHDRDDEWLNHYEDITILIDQVSEAVTHRQLVDILLDPTLDM